MPSKIRHLLSRDGRYYARVSIPSALRPALGKREFLEPLGADRAEALRKHPAAVAQMQAALEAARGQVRSQAPRPIPRGRPMTIPQMAKAYYQDQMRFDDECRNTDPRYAIGFIDEDYVARLRRATTGASSNDEMQATVGRIIRRFVDGGHVKVTPGTAEWRELARALAGIELEALSRTAERDEGDFNGQPTHPLLTEKPEAEAIKDALAVRRISPQSDLPLSELAEAYMKERGTTASVNRETEVAVRMLEEHLGEARPVYQITRADLLAFKRALAETPRNYVSRFPSTALPDAIKANKQRRTPYPCLSTRTIGNKYLSRVHSLLGWCAQNDILPDSPATGIKVNVVRKAEPPRVNFAPSDLSKIFSPKRFDTSKPFSEKQWAELLSLFTGARASELGQVRLDSIRTERGVLVMRIEEATKNRGSQRLVPVHGTLIRLGLEKHVQELRQKGATHLFPVWHRKATEAKTNATTGDGKAMLNHYYPRYYPKVFNRELRKIRITDRRMSWHSFRHTFRTGLELAGVSKPTADRLTGHVDGSMASVYTHGVSLEVLKEAIDRLRFDGFDL